MKTIRIGEIAGALAVAFMSFAVFGDLTGPFTETVGGITWTYSVRDGVAVLGYEPFVKRAVHPTTAGTLTIPAKLGGYPVREIGEYAFHSCQKLTSVTIPEGVTTIAPRSFTWCGISSLNLPKSVSEITGAAFATSGRSENEYSIAVTVTAGNEHYKTVDGFLLTKDGTELVFSPMLKTRAALPSTVKRIGIDAFCNHIHLEEVVLPASVGSVGASAFLDCSNLKRIVFGGNAPTVGDSAFRNTSATGYVGVGTAGWGAVPGTWNGVSLVYGKDNGGPYTETVDGIEWTYYIVNGGAEPRRGGNLRTAISTNTVGTVEIPGSLGGRPVTSVGNGSFYKCDKVTNVIVPETVTNIANSAFGLCGARTVKLPACLAAIGQDSFSWSEFRSLTIPEGVKEIPYYALSYCKSMTSVTLPSTLEKIGASAFIRDNSLTSLYLPAALKSIGTEGLSCCPNLKLAVDPNSKTFKMVDGFLMSKDGAELVCCPGGISNGSIPSGTEVIRDNAFRECMRVTKIVIPEGVTNIGYMAFCFMDNIKSISFPHSYRNSGNTMLFGGGCANGIHDVAMPGEETAKSLFGGTSAATNLVIIAGTKTVIAHAVEGCTTLEAVTFPDGLQRIEDYSFAGCTALKSVAIPSSVTYIGPHAFDGCASLSKIMLPGTLPAGVSGSGLLAQATEVSCKRADVKTVQGLVPDGCDVYFWTTNGQRMKIMGNPPSTEGEEESGGIIMEVCSTDDSGEGTLREALAVAQDGDMILFNLDKGSEIVLTTPLVATGSRFSGKGLTIGGDNGGRCVTVNGNGTFQLLTVQSGSKVFVDGITFKNGKDGFGGAIGNYGALTVRNCGFVGNESPAWGGAIANNRAASCFVQNCDFVGNKCDGWGGAVVSHTTALTTILGCRFADNTCKAWGGAIAAYSSGDMLIVNCEIHGNLSYGGAVSVASNARVTIIGSNISDNEATYEGADVYNLGNGTVYAIGSYCKDKHGAISGTTDLKPLPSTTSSLVSTEAKALGSWYSQVVDASGRASMQLNAQACPRFAARTDGKPTFEVTDEEYVTMKVENVKPLLYYGLGWSETPSGEFVVEPGLWVQADVNGVLPGDVKAPKGTGASRFFRVKVTDDPTVVQ